MYQVKIFNGPADKKGTIIQSADAFGHKVDAKGLKLGINVINSFAFDLTPANPGYALIKPKTTLIEVLDVPANEIVFRGRALSPEDSQAESMLVSASFLFVSELDYLHDSIQEFKKVQNTTPKRFLTDILNVHNSQVEDYKKFYIGEVDVTNPTDNVYRYLDDTADTFDTIMEKLVSRDSLGGELSVTYDKDGKRRLNWLKRIGGKSKQKIELTKNILSMTRKHDADNVVTRLFPRGVRQEGKEGDVSTPRLDIKSVNDGKPYLDADKALIDLFGINGDAQVWDDVTKPDILKKKGQDWLKNQTIAVGSFSVKALDLSLVGLAADRFKAGWDYDTINPTLNINYPLRIEQLNLDVNNPAQSTLDLGEKKLKLSQYNAQAKRLAVQVKNLKDEVAGSYTKLAGLAIQLNEAEQQLSDLQDAVNTGSADVTKKFQELQDTLDAIQASVTDPSVISDMQQGITGNAQAINANVAEIELLKTKQLDLENRVKALENK